DHNWKSADDLIHKLCDIANKGGNFLLNVGPTELGEFTPETQDRLATVGQWMKANGESIYGTTQSPFKKLPFDGPCTQKGNTLYFQVFTWPEGDLRLPPMLTRIRSARALSDGKPLNVVTTINGGVMIHALSRPGKLDPIATVVAVDFDGSTKLPEIV